MNDYEKNILKNYLKDYADRKLEPCQGRYKGFYICPFCESGTGIHRTPAFHLYDDNRQYKCSACGEWGDIFSLVMKVEGLTFSEALDRVQELYGTPDGNIMLSRMVYPKRNEQPVNVEPVPPSAEYQKCLMSIVERAKESIFEEVGRDAREYLLSRKIDEQTIREHGIGFIPVVTKDSYLIYKGTSFTVKTPFPNSKYPDMWIPFGITFPYIMDGKLFHLETRRTPSQLQLMLDCTKPDVDGNKAKPDKTGHVTGWKTSLFNADDALCTDKRRDILFTEGIIDALSINQTVGRWCNDEIKAVTFGACTAQGDPDEFYKWYVMPYRIVIGFDNDDAGRENSKKLAEKISQARRNAGRTDARTAFPPERYNDWNEFLVNDESSVFEYVTNLFPLTEYTGDSSHERPRTV